MPYPVRRIGPKHHEIGIEASRNTASPGDGVEALGRVDGERRENLSPPQAGGRHQVVLDRVIEVRQVADVGAEQDLPTLATR